MDVAALCALPVGIVRWERPEPALTVIVKATFALDRSGEAALSGQQEPLGLDEPHAEPDGHEPRIPSDFAPRKRRADVLLVGHVATHSAATSLSARLRVDRLERRFVAVASQPATTLPLVSRYLRDPSAPEGPAVQVGPLPAPSQPWRGHLGDERVDFAEFNVAPPPQQLDSLRANCELELENLLPNAPLREVRLPGIRPVCFYVASRTLEPTPDRPIKGALEVILRCDTLWIDTDRAICTLTWRGVQVLPPKHDDSQHLVVALQTGTKPRAWSDVSSELPKAHWLSAVEPDTALVPPAWVRTAPRVRTMPVVPVPRAAAPKRRPRRETARVLVEPTAGRAETAPLPFVASPAGASPRPSTPSSQPPAARGTTAVIDREALVRGRALPFESGPPPVDPEVTETDALWRVPSVTSHDRAAHEGGIGTPAAARSGPTADATESTGARTGRAGGEGAAPFVPRPPSPLTSAPAAGHSAPGSLPGTAPRTDEPTTARAKEEHDAIPLETYARVKTELWRHPGAMADILRRYEIDEADWLANESRQEQALVDEAHAGRNELATKLRQALGNARAARETEPAPSLSLDAYVELRVDVDVAEDPSIPLARRGLSAEQWNRLRRHWHERSLADPALARKLRAALASARQLKREREA